MLKVFKRRNWWLAAAVPIVVFLGLEGCQALSDRLSKWNMLETAALEDPIKAVGGDGIVFAPLGIDHARDRSHLAALAPNELVAYYAPIFVQQRINTAIQSHPYPKEYDEIGEARIRQEDDGKLKAFVAGPPKVYAVYEKRPISGHDHVQLTYTAWYPAHPRMKAIDLEAAAIDSCVVRVTLDKDNAPLFYETIAACGCFHKVFIERWIEEKASQAYGMPEKNKKYVVERVVKGALDWEVAGLVDEPPESPRRPVVFLKAGDHKVIGMGSAARLRVPKEADSRTYSLVEYSELYSLPVQPPLGHQLMVGNPHDRAPFFDMEDGGKVYGAQRKERFIFSLIGVDDAGQPRALDKIKLHFDQSTWSDPTIYERYLRLPPGVL
jgi:hypothetical protein